MKKIKFIACIMAIIFAVLVFQRCSKEKIDTTNLDSQQDQDEYFLIKKIHRFIDLAEQNRNGLSLKSGEKVIIDSAFFYIDATFNYTYCFHTSKYNKMHWDTTYTEFPVDTESEVLLDDVLIAYNDAVDKVRLKYIAISDTTKKLVAVVFEDMGTNANNHRQVRIISQIGTGTSTGSILGTSGNFNIDDEYWFEEGSYRCDETGEEGAPDILEYEIYFKYLPAFPPNYRVWFSNSEIYSPVYSSFQIDYTPDNYCDYRIFYADNEINTIDDETKCLDYDQNGSGIHEMDFYLDGAEYVLLYWRDNPTTNPDGKDFENCFFTHKVLGDPYRIKHELNYTFGIKHVIESTSINAHYPLAID